MMSLQRTSSEAVTSAMTSDAFKVNGDATDRGAVAGEISIGGLLGRKCVISTQEDGKNGVKSRKKWFKKMK